ncbi:hypothetical protein T07_2409 [Trichinella nelsoni]|uniref:Uncharacterized protein n=1 Tax=Trichinella nelsoni TaxID=6336 RepID=A0A0V0SG38_9BILA|nr:hypothetical protein T07_2409 [Trichinella nelsoni]
MQLYLYRNCQINVMKFAHFLNSVVTLCKQLVHRIGQKCDKSNYSRFQSAEQLSRAGYLPFRSLIKKSHKIDFPVSLEDWTMHPVVLNMFIT